MKPKPAENPCELLTDRVKSVGWQNLFRPVCHPMCRSSTESSVGNHPASKNKQNNYMTQQMIDFEISSPGAAPGADNMQPTEFIGFSRGRQSLDHSVWYNGALMTFLATGEDTHGQFALIEAVARRGNVPPPHIHHREDEIF